MSKMQNMSDEQIRKAIETYNKKLPLIPEGEDRDLCLVGLENFQNELKRRAQKKNEVQLTGKNEQPEQRTEAEEIQLAMQQRDEMLKTKEWQQSNQLNNIERVLVATLEPSQVVQVPVVQITLRKEKMFERDGKRVKETFEVKETMTQSEILTMLKTYFKTLVNSENWKAGRYTEGKSGNMGFNVFELFKGWNAIYQITEEGEPYPIISEVYPGYRHTSQDQRVGAEILHRWATKQQ